MLIWLAMLSLLDPCKRLCCIQRQMLGRKPAIRHLTAREELCVPDILIVAAIITAAGEERVAYCHALPVRMQHQAS